MTPPSTAAARKGGHSRTVRRSPAPRTSRRISGPARPPRTALAGATAGRAPLSLRLSSTAMRVGDARVLDRLVRGRAWIALMAIGLMGIVFMQVSMLRLNAGISRAVTAADTLERQNSTLRADISKLGSGERIQDVAADLGMVTPDAGNVHDLDGARADAVRAAASITPPDPAKAAAAAAAARAAGAAPANGAGATGAATTGTAPTGAGATSTGAAATGPAATGAGGTGTGAATGAGATGAGATAGPAATGAGVTGTGSAANGAGTAGAGVTGTGSAATGAGATGAGAATGTGASGTGPAATGAVAGGASAPQVQG
jgi:cell division protein FtsL